MAQGYYYERITMQRKLTIYYTSDVHGYFSPVDYASGKSAQSGLANCMNGFANDGNTLIIDGGDILQGAAEGADGGTAAVHNIKFFHGDPPICVFYRRKAPPGFLFS